MLTTDPHDANFLAPVGSLRSRGIDVAALRLGHRWQTVATYAWNRVRYDDTNFATTNAQRA